MSKASETIDKYFPLASELEIYSVYLKDRGKRLIEEGIKLYFGESLKEEGKQLLLKGIKTRLALNQRRIVTYGIMTHQIHGLFNNSDTNSSYN